MSNADKLCEGRVNNDPVEKWQSRLGLQDWIILLHQNCTSDETDHCTAQTEWDEVHKAAVIKVIDPSQYGDRMLPFNFEKTLIHELLHIKFALFDGYGDFQDRYLHQIIEEFAKILYDMEEAKKCVKSAKK